MNDKVSRTIFVQYANMILSCLTFSDSTNSVRRVATTRLLVEAVDSRFTSASPAKQRKSPVARYGSRLCVRFDVRIRFNAFLIEFNNFGLNM